MVKQLHDGINVIKIPAITYSEYTIIGGYLQDLNGDVTYMSGKANEDFTPQKNNRK